MSYVPSVALYVVEFTFQGRFDPHYPPQFSISQLGIRALERECATPAWSIPRRYKRVWSYSMISLVELRRDGFTRVYGITTGSDLLSLARSIGRPVLSPTGELLKEITPTDKVKARSGTLSAKHGTGSFPLHTDTAFWPVPCRYLIMRAYGDCRRATTVLKFADIFQRESGDLHVLVERSIWRVRTPSAGHYCSMQFRYRKAVGWRYDEHCMIPVNEAATIIHAELPALLARCKVQRIEWSRDMALIIDNWQLLHGRAEAPAFEQLRILQRIYVE
jgi:hypothetical protein